MRPSELFSRRCQVFKDGSKNQLFTEEEDIISNHIYSMLTAVEMLSKEQARSTKESLQFLRRNTTIRPDSTWTNVLEAIIQIVEDYNGPIKTEETGEGESR